MQRREFLGATFAAALATSLDPLRVFAGAKTQNIDASLLSTLWTDAGREAVLDWHFCGRQCKAELWLRSPHGLEVCIGSVNDIKPGDTVKVDITQYAVIQDAVWVDENKVVLWEHNLEPHCVMSGDTFNLILPEIP